MPIISGSSKTDKGFTSHQSSCSLVFVWSFQLLTVPILVIVAPQCLYHAQDLSIFTFCAFVNQVGRMVANADLEATCVFVDIIVGF